MAIATEMNVSFCDISSEMLPNEDVILQGIQSIMKKGEYISGMKHTLFERDFAIYIGVQHCIGVGNGTDAIEIAIESLQLEQGTTVFVQGNSCIATAIAVKHQTTPYHLVLIDVVPETGMIDLREVEAKAKEIQGVKVIIVTHLFGYMPNMEEVLACCHRNNMILIEDCAQAHGALWKGQKAGSFGRLSCFSFYPTKNLGGFGDGGAILTNETSLSDWIRRRANMGSVVKNQFDILGRNSRLDTIQASVLLDKLPYLDANNEKRRRIATLYNRILCSITEIQTIVYDTLCQPVYHLYVIRAKQRNELQHFLKQHGITTLIHYPTCIAKTDACIGMGDTPVSESLSHEMLSLPMYPGLYDDIPKIVYVACKIREFYGYRTFVGTDPYTFQTKAVDDKSGLLHAINDMRSFHTKRIFYVDGFETAVIPIQRGNHCNQRTNKIISVLKGMIWLELEYTTGKTESVLVRKNDSYYVPSGVWNCITILDKSTVVLVCCDTTFDEHDTITDYAVFKGM